MPRVADELSALDVKRIRHPGRQGNMTMSVGGVSGLLIQVTPTQAKSWILRTVIGTRRREIGLGGYPDVSLSQARDRAREAKDAIRNGEDPVERRRAVKAALTAASKRGLTFSSAVDRYLDSKLAEFRNAKHRLQWRSSLDNYALPAIGELMVSDISVADIQRTLSPLWNSKTVTAARTRGRIEAVLDWARVAGYRTGDNPARWRGNLDALLPKPGKVSRAQNHPAVSLQDASAWFTALRAKEGVSAKALEFLALCGSRSGEVRGATWEEIDLQSGIWTVPAARMKMDREHRVPLSESAIRLLNSIWTEGATGFLFSAQRGGMLSDMSLSAVMRRMHADAVAIGGKGWLDSKSGRAAVPHGLRSTFRDWAAETGVDRDMAELALAHNVGSDVERSYRRSDMLARRRAMMDAWSRFLEGAASAKVVKLPTSK